MDWRQAMTTSVHFSNCKPAFPVQYSYPIWKDLIRTCYELTSLLLQYNVTLNSVHEVTIKGQPERAYSISVTPNQLNHLQSFLPSINRSFDAVLIPIKQQGRLYMIAYAADTGKMGDFHDTFQNILNSVSFSPISGA